MSNLIHRGVKVSVNHEGVFYTEDSADILDSLEATTLEELKKLIDAAKTTPKQQPIAGFVLSRDGWLYGDGVKASIVPVTITGLFKEKEGIYNAGKAVAWIRRTNGDREKRDISSVYLDTPANKKIAKEWLSCKLKVVALEEQATALVKKLENPKLPPPIKATPKLKFKRKG